MCLPNHSTGGTPCSSSSPESIPQNVFAPQVSQNLAAGTFRCLSSPEHRLYSGKAHLAQYVAVSLCSSFLQRGQTNALLLSSTFGTPASITLVVGAFSLSPNRSPGMYPSSQNCSGVTPNAVHIIWNRLVVVP